MCYTCRVFEWYDKVGGSTGIYVRGSILLGQCLFITTTTRMKGKHLKGRRKSGFLKIFFLRDCVLLLYVIDRLLHCNLLLNNAIRKLAKNILKYVCMSTIRGRSQTRRTGANFQFILGVHQSTKKFKNCHCNTLNHKSLHLP